MRCQAKEGKNGYDKRIERRGEERMGKEKVETAVSFFNLNFRFLCAYPKFGSRYFASRIG